MPIQAVKTRKDGRKVTGYRWGTSGKIYTGPGARARAQRQAAAAYSAGYRKR